MRLGSFVLLLLLSLRLEALEIAAPGPEAFDLALEPELTLKAEQEMWVACRLQAWTDWSLEPQSLEADALDEQGKVLRVAKDLATPLPFKQYFDGFLLVPVPAGTRTLRFRVRGRGPAIGNWKILPGSVLGSSPMILVEGAQTIGNGVIELAAESGASSFELRGVSGTVGRLNWGPEWKLLGNLKKDLAQYSPGTHQWLFQGPQGQRCVMQTIVAWGGNPPSAFMQIQVLHAGLGKQEMALWFEATGQGDWLLPFNQGLQVPAQEAGELDPGYDLDMAAGHFISMPIVGWSQAHGTVLLRCMSSVDVALRLRLGDKKLAFVAKPSLGALRSAFIMVVGITRPGAVPWAQEIRRAEGSRRGYMPADYQSRFPGAVNIHYWKNLAQWSNEPNPEALAKSMLDAGLDRVLWSQKASAEAVAALKSMGWIPGSYENFQDLYPTETPLDWVNKDGWPEQAVLLRHGGWRKGWPHKQGGKTFYAGVRSSRAAVDYVKEVLQARVRHGQKAIFLDTTTASGPVEDWNPLHPMSTADDHLFKSRQLSDAREKGLIVGSESGHNAALSYVHYFEGMQSPWPGRFEDSGYDLGSIRPATEAMKKWNLNPRYRAPLFELAYHDLYVGYEYWGDAANRLPEHWRRKDLFSVLYGQPQLWVMDEERWKTQKAQAIQSYRTWSPVVRHLFGQRMTDWKVLDKDGDVQETHWEDGSIVRVDFAKDKIVLEGPLKAAAAKK